jgi:NADP-dependent 3-hydroxy acid dehydrogenase YdfG
MSDTLRDEVNGDGIRVLTVYPGRTATPRQERIFAMEGRAYTPERLLQPQDIAAMIVASLKLPRTAEVTNLTIRPMQKA